MALGRPGRKPGGSKHGGRAKGTPNKKTLALLERIEQSGKDPVQVMLDLLNDQDPVLRFQASKELLQYMYPKRKALEVAVDPQEHVHTVSDELLEIFKATYRSVKAERVK